MSIINNLLRPVLALVAVSAIPVMVQAESYYQLQNSQSHYQQRQGQPIALRGRGDDYTRLQRNRFNWDRDWDRRQYYYQYNDQYYRTPGVGYSNYDSNYYNDPSLQSIYPSTYYYNAPMSQYGYPMNNYTPSYYNP